MDQIDFDRLILKQQAIDLRVARFGRCFCDLCRTNIGMEYHEIVTRRYTIPSEIDRVLSFRPEICSLLCPSCHVTAMRPDNVLKLLEFNANLYGSKEVKEAIRGISEQFWPPAVRRYLRTA